MAGIVVGSGLMVMVCWWMQGWCCGICKYIGGFRFRVMTGIGMLVGAELVLW